LTGLPTLSEPNLPSPPTTAPASRRRILLVDDNADVREISAVLLRRAGYAVDTAEDGEAAWQALTTAPYDLLVTDYSLPGLSGLELIARVRALPSALPVILASGTLNRSALSPAQGQAIDVVLAKPFAWSHLLATVTQVLEGVRR